MTITHPLALRATDVSMAYGRDRIVHDASIALTPGCVTALVGPNGSGKSTLLRGLTALHRPSGGSVVFADGADASGLGERELARRIALLAQSHPEPSGVSVREVVAYGRFAHRGRFRTGDPNGADVIDRAMAATGIADLTDQPVSQLSGGQRQRVWLATCLAQQTGIVLLDEPTTFLDVRYQREILEIVRDLADDGVAVGIVLHDLEQAAEIADEVVLLVHGRIVATGTPEQVFTPERLTAAYEVPIDVEPVEDGLRIRPQRLRRRPAVSRAA
ncbi:iron complex transport system ATP-binding protein [Agrococcus baldri]|uniref:Iron complex transport system ATP-binding protein n=1 Tax=Agrococcus baldri TaxID=153730 RepID=A0AA94L0G1_9MICO|nr:ABC transporter ATP-binding protein [Agrococcus baldri]SFS17796.1 iron complex transport system ATP-binding protein [Agrococcus baldri]